MEGNDGTGEDAGSLNQHGLTYEDYLHEVAHGKAATKSPGRNAVDGFGEDDDDDTDDNLLVDNPAQLSRHDEIMVEAVQNTPRGHRHHHQQRPSSSSGGDSGDNFETPTKQNCSRYGNGGGGRRISSSAMSSSSKPMSPFSPLLKWRSGGRPSDAGAQEEPHTLTLSKCRKVSVVVKIDSASAAGDAPKVCLFPLVESSGTTPLKSNRKSSLGESHGDGAASLPSSPTSKSSAASPSASSVAFWKQQQQTDDDDNNGNVAYSPRDVVVVNPTAFGKEIPTEITMERARLVSQVARRSSTEDWIRSYRFHQVVWPDHAVPNNAAGTALPAPPSPLVLVAQAMARDLTDPGSISTRTVIGVGHYSTPDHTTFHPKTLSLFGTIAQESVAHVLSSTDEELYLTENQQLHRYGLLGLTAAKILQHQKLQRQEQQRRNSSSSSASSSDGDDLLSPPTQLTLSVIEISEEDEALYDLQKTKPFQPGNVSLRFVDNTPHAGANLVGVTDHPVDSIKAVGRCIRRALGMAHHSRRLKHGSILAILKAWSGTKCTTAQFLDVAMVQSEPEAQAIGSAILPGMAEQREALHRRNAAVRKSVTALGGILRRLLLQEAGNDTIISFREYTLTKVLQRSLLQTDSKVVVLANVSPLVSEYEETMATLRYAYGILTKSPGLLQSPFDTDRHRHSNLTSPTSHSMTDDGEDDDEDESLGLALGLRGLLRNVVGDPRQRMAKLVKPRPKVLDDEMVPLDDDAGRIPTRYMPVDPGTVGDALDRRARELMEASRIDEGLPTPLMQNRSYEFESDYKEAPQETTLELDAMERGGRAEIRTGGYDEPEPSPLTAETVEARFIDARNREGYEADRIPIARSAGTDPIIAERKQRHYFPDDGPDAPQDSLLPLDESESPSSANRYQVERSMEQKMEDLSLELQEKTQGEVLAQMELERLKDDITARDQRIAQLEESIEKIEEHHLVKTEEVAELINLMEVEADEKRKELEKELELKKQELQNELEERRQDMENELERQHRELYERDTEVRRLQETIDNMSKSMEDSGPDQEELRRLLDLVTAQLKNRDRQVEQLQQMMESSKRSQSQLDHDSDHEKQELRRQLDLIGAQLVRRDKDVEQLRQTVEESKLASGRPSKDEDYEKLELQRQLDLVSAQLARREKEIEEQQRTISDSKLEQDETATRLLADREAAQRDAQEARQYLQDEVDRLRGTVESRDQELLHLREAVDQNEGGDHDSTTQMVAQIASERDRAEKEANLLRHQLKMEKDELKHQINRLEQDARQLERSLESSRLRFDSQDARTRALLAERDLAEKEAREARRKLENEAENRRFDSERREEEIRHLKETNERLRKIAEQSRDEEVEALRNERDEALRDALSARKQLEDEFGDRLEAIERREKEIQQLRDSLENARLEQQPVDGVLEELTAQRDMAMQDARNARQQLETEVKCLRNDVASREEEVVRLQEELRKKKHQNEEMEKTIADQLNTSRGEAERDNQHLQQELDQMRLSLATRDVRIAELQEFGDKLRQQYQQAKDEIEGDLDVERKQVEKLRRDLHRAEEETKAEREKAESLAHSSHQLLNLEQEGFSREIQRRDDEIRELKDTLARSKAYQQQVHDDAAAEMVSELKRAEDRAVEAEKQLQIDADLHRQELERREKRIRDLEATVKKLQSELSEALNLADEAIMTQSRTEKKVAELERQLASHAAGTVPREKFRDLEKAHAAASKELHETKGEVFHYKSELNDTKMALTELQFNLHATEKERDHFVSRESDMKREVERLQNQLVKAQDGGEESSFLRSENERLMNEVDVLNAEIRERESDLRRQLADKDDACRRHLDELEGLKQELSDVLQTQQLQNEQHLTGLQKNLSSSQKALAEAEKRYNKIQEKLSAEIQARDALANELDRTRSDLGCRLADVEDLSSNLNQILEEKEEAVSKVSNLKRALASFQDDTRSRVEKFVHHRSETKALLERTLEENDALVQKNRELQALLDGRYSTTPGVDSAILERNEALSIENAELSSKIRKLQVCFNDPDTLSTGQQRQQRRRPESARLRATGSTGSAGVPRADDAEALLQETLLGESTAPLRRQSAPSSDDLVASIAIAAKKSVEQSNAERNYLREELRAAKRGDPRTSAATVESLSRRLRTLEGQLGDHNLGYDLDNTVLLSEEEMFQLLFKRVRALERRVQEEEFPVFRGVRR